MLPNQTTTLLPARFQCGVSSLNTPKVVGGTDVTPGELPWQVPQHFASFCSSVIHFFMIITSSLF
jgi:hypothetical protein